MLSVRIASNKCTKFGWSLLKLLQENPAVKMNSSWGISWKATTKIHNNHHTTVQQQLQRLQLAQLSPVKGNTRAP